MDESDPTDGDVVDDDSSDVDVDIPELPDGLHFVDYPPRVLDPLCQFSPCNENTPGLSEVCASGDVIDIFLSLFGDAMELAYSETKRQSQLKFCSQARNKPISKEEFTRFIAVLIHMSLIRMKRLDDYWNAQFFGSTLISDLMNRHRFRLICDSLHLVDEEEAQRQKKHDRQSSTYDPVYKITTYLNKIFAATQHHYKPNCRLVVDEMMAPFAVSTLATFPVLQCSCFAMFCNVLQCNA